MRNWLFAWWGTCLLLSAVTASGQTSYKFVPITLCRAVCTFCTGWGNGTFAGPALGDNSSRDFPLVSSSCGIPVDVVAYSLNVTVVPKGVLWYVTIWPTGQDKPEVSTLNAQQGQVLANAAIVPAGRDGGVSVYTTNATDLILDLNGYFVSDDSSNRNTGTSSTGSFNTGFGDASLQGNTGSNNTATGSGALSRFNSGPNNVAVGFRALASNSTGGANTAIGSMSEWGNVAGADNVAIGFNSLLNNSLGNENTALGANSLPNVTQGSNNIGIGYSAGSQVTSGTNNIDIGNSGSNNDSNVIRIGTSGTHNATYIAGISKNAVTGSVVLVDQNGQLGTVLSSRRYKQNIRDMEGASEGLWRLRPVTFRYKTEGGRTSAPLQYGLIAEEVAEVYPELVIRDSDGQVQSVQYQELPSMLLNELQKQHQTIAEQQQSLKAQSDEIRLLEQRMCELERLVKISPSH